MFCLMSQGYNFGVIKNSCKFGLFLILQSIFIAAEAFAFPKVSLSKDTHDFGDVNQGEVVKQTFTIKNSGDQVLKIDRIIPACGCTVSEVKKNQLAPGEQTELEVALDTRGFSGNKIKTVRIYTNDPDQITKLITLKGNILPEVVVQPQRVNFGEVIKSEDSSDWLEQLVLVKIRPNSSATLGKVVSRSNWIKVSEISSSPKEKKLKIKLNPNVKVGEFRDRVVVTVNNSQQTTLNLPIYASISSPIFTKPSVVSFGIITGKEPKIRQLKVVSKGKEKISIEQVKTEHPAITARVLESNIRSKDPIVELTIDPVKVKKDLKSAVTIEVIKASESLSEPSTTELAVTVTAVLPPDLLLNRR